jgi:hypothetical protein
MIRFLIKIWPAFLPIIIYLLWIYVIQKLLKKYFKKKEVIEGEYKVVNKEETLKVSQFSLHNQHFVIMLYFSLIIAILALILTAVK